MPSASDLEEFLLQPSLSPLSSVLEMEGVVRYVHLQHEAASANVLQMKFEKTVFGTPGFVSGTEASVEEFMN